MVAVPRSSSSKKIVIVSNPYQPHLYLIRNGYFRILNSMVLPLSTAEKNLWSKRLLCQWLDGAQQVLIDSVGYEEALELLKPHAINTGMAGTQFAMGRLGIKEHRVEDILTAFKFTHLAMGRKDSRIRVGELGGYIDFFSCPFEKSSPLYCTFFCDMVGGSGASLAGPGYDWHFAKSLCLGDDYCRKGLVLKGHAFNDMKKNEMVIVEPPPFQVSEEELAWFSRAYYGEFWAIFTRCLIEIADAEGAIGLMSPFMRQSGMVFGIEAKEILEIETSMDAFFEVTGFFFDMFGMKAERTDEGWSITECPFSNSGPEIGAQLEVFINGIAEGIGVPIKMTCHQKMCNGGEHCTINFKK